MKQYKDRSPLQFGNANLVEPLPLADRPVTPIIIYPPVKLAVKATEACRLLSIGHTCFYSLIKRGLIKPCRATSPPLFSTKMLQEFLDETSKTIEI